MNLSALDAGQWIQLVVAVVAALLGGGVVVVKWMNRKVDASSVRKTDSERIIDFVEAVRADNGDLRTDRDEERERADAERRRADAAEGRERTMATMVAAHEVWDVKAYPVLIEHDSHYPPPPPLSPLTSAQVTVAAQEASALS